MSIASPSAEELVPSPSWTKLKAQAVQAMTVKDRRTSQAFIRSQSLPPPGSGRRNTVTEAASVVGSTAILFDKMAGAQQKSDVEDSFLYATTTADGASGRTDESKSITWYNTFFTTLHLIGWSVPPEFRFEVAKRGDSFDTVAQAVLVKLTNLWDARTLRSLRNVLYSFKSRQPPSEPYKVLNRNAWKVSAANFRFAVASLDADYNVRMTITVFLYKDDTAPDNPDILFGATSDKAVLKYADVNLLLDQNAYDQVREAIRIKVGNNYLSDFYEIPDF